MRQSIRLTLLAVLSTLATAAFSQGTNLQIIGNVAYQTHTNATLVDIQIDEIRNDSASQTSGTIHVILWATITNNPVGNGYTLTDVSLVTLQNSGTLAPGASFTSIQLTNQPFSVPPDGTYYIHLVVVEAGALSTILDSVTFQNQVTFGPPPPPADDHGDTFGTASILSVNSSRAGDIEVDGDLDMFEISVPDSGLLAVYSTGSTDTTGTLFDSGQAQIGFNDDSDPGANTNFRLERQVNAGTYFLRVAGYQSTTGPYTAFADFTANSAPPLDVAGPWTITETSTDNCGDGGGSVTYVLNVTQNGNNITVRDDDGNTFFGTINGNTLTWSGSFPEDGGTTTISSLTATVTNTSISGSSIWDWDDGFDSCNGTTTFSGSRGSNLPPPSSGGGGGGGGGIGLLSLLALGWVCRRRLIRG